MTKALDATKGKLFCQLIINTGSWPSDFRRTINYDPIKKKSNASRCETTETSPDNSCFKGDPEYTNQQNKVVYQESVILDQFG